MLSASLNKTFPSFLPSHFGQLRSELENRLSRRERPVPPLHQDRPAHSCNVEEIKAEHVPFIDAYAINAEFELWQHKTANRGLVANWNHYTNSNRIFKVPLTMPVSTVSAERPCSSPRGLRYLRNIVSGKRSTGLALWHIHRNINLDVHRVINDFDATGHRRIARAFSNPGGNWSSGEN